MNLPLISALALLALAACDAVPARADAPAETSIAEAVRGLERNPGLFDLYLDHDEGRAWIALPAPDDTGVHAAFLYAEGLTTGLGSNPVGLDRGQVRGPWLVRFRSVGGKVLLERPNLAFRAESDDADERRATAQSFATSVLWSAPKVERTTDGGVLVDISTLLVRDVHGVAGTLGGDGGSWGLDDGRSAVDTSACLAFPDNLELEALLTFRGKGAGRNVRSTSPDATAVSLVQHHSFIRLPDEGYTPRRHDPRTGAFGLSFLDYAAPLDGDMRTKLAQRHRLPPLAGRPLDRHQHDQLFGLQLVLHPHAFDTLHARAADCAHQVP